MENTIGNYWVGTKIGPDGDILHRYLTASGLYAGGQIGTIVLKVNEPLYHSLFSQTGMGEVKIEDAATHVVSGSILDYSITNKNV